MRVRVKNIKAILIELIDSNEISEQQTKDLTLERRKITHLVKSTWKDKGESDHIILTREDRREDYVAERKYIAVLMKQQKFDIYKICKEAKIDKDVLERMKKAQLKDVFGF